MNIKEELQMYQKAYDALKEIPYDFRSMNHTAYKNELSGRLDVLEQHLLHLNQHSNEQ